MKRRRASAGPFVAQKCYKAGPHPKLFSALRNRVPTSPEYAVERAIKGWTCASTIHAICAADIGHMDATTAPINVWGESQGRFRRLDPEG
jgi:hypothetical protein